MTEVILVRVNTHNFEVEKVIPKFRVFKHLERDIRSYPYLLSAQTAQYSQGSLTSHGWFDILCNTESLDEAVQEAVEFSKPGPGTTGFDDRIRSLVYRGDIHAARELLDKVPDGQFSHLDEWKRVLAFPNARSTGQATGRDTKLDSNWLTEHAKEFLDQWVAIKNGILIDHHEDRSSLREALKNSNQLAGALLVKC